MKSKLISILFALSFAHLSSVHGAEWIITEETGVQNEYEHFRKAAVKDKQPEAEQTDCNAADLFCGKTSAELGDLCSQLKNSKIYVRGKTLTAFPPPEKFADVPTGSGEEKVELKYASRPLKSFHGIRSDNIMVFPCKTHESRVYWLTYGYSENRMFLLKDVDDGRAVSFVGQSEIIPQIDDEHPEGEKLENYFYEATPKSPSSKHESYPFVNSVQFRLCCLVHAAKQNAARPKKEESFTLNYADSDLRSTFHKHKVKSHQRKDDDEIDVRALGCAINRKETSDIEFHLFYDEQDPNAVFALRGEVQANKETKFVLTARYRDLRLPIRAALSL